MVGKLGCKSISDSITSRFDNFRTGRKLTLRSPSLIEFLGQNPEPVRGSKIARQTERRRMYPWRGAPNCDFDRSCRIIDDPLKPGEALSDAQRQAANEWDDHTLYSPQNDKQHGALVIIMQRLHE